MKTIFYINIIGLSVMPVLVSLLFPLTASAGWDGCTRDSDGSIFPCIGNRGDDSNAPSLAQNSYTSESNIPNLFQSGCSMLSGGIGNGDGIGKGLAGPGRPIDGHGSSVFPNYRATFTPEEKMEQGKLTRSVQISIFRKTPYGQEDLLKSFTHIDTTNYDGAPKYPNGDYPPLPDGSFDIDEYNRVAGAYTIETSLDSSMDDGHPAKTYPPGYLQCSVIWDIQKYCQARPWDSSECLGQ